MKIKATFADGRKRVLKSPDELCKIDQKRRALFVFDNWQVYSGYSDGEVDEDGDFGVFCTIHGIALPFNRLIGWCYENDKKGKACD